MFCYNCGKDCGDSARFCRDCGTQLRQTIQTEQKTEQAYPKPPFPMLASCVGCIEFGDRNLRLRVKRPLAPRIDVMIPYNEIVDISYIPATTWLQGFLCVRGLQDRYNAMPRTVWECSRLDTIILFERHGNDSFYRAYVFLKEIAQINASKK